MNANSVPSTNVIPRGSRLLALKRGQHALRDGSTVYTVRILCFVHGAAFIVTPPAAALLGREVNDLTGTLSTAYTEDELIARLSRKLFGCPDALVNARRETWA